MENIIKKGMIIGILYFLLLGYLFLVSERIERLEDNCEIPISYYKK